MTSVLDTMATGYSYASAVKTNINPRSNCAEAKTDITPPRQVVPSHRARSNPAEAKTDTTPPRQDAPTHHDGMKESVRDGICFDCNARNPSHPLKCGQHKVCVECLEKRGEALASKKGELLRCAGPHDDPEVMAAERPENVWIYVDDSNIWIEAMKLVNKKRKFKTSQDYRIRLDIGRLTEAVADGRAVAKGFLYGSEPPPIDTVWRKIEELGWKVDRKKKHPITGKEKKVDTQLVADITERACNTPEHDRTTIIIIAGDADVKPAIDKILKYKGWKVEVYMWKGAMARELKDLGKESESVKVGYLDNRLEKITFTNMRFKPTDKYFSPQVKANSIVLTMKKKPFKKRIPTKEWVQQLENLAQRPFQYYWLKSEDETSPETDDLLIYFKPNCINPDDQIDIPVLLEEIREWDLSLAELADPYLTYEQRQSGLYQCAFEYIGQYNVDDISDGMEIDNLSVSDDQDSWGVVDHYKLKSRLHQKYTDPCQYGFNCIFGKRCQNKHTEKEKKYFTTRQGKGNPLRKVKPCQFYEKGKCHKSAEECQWAHGEEDAWCLICGSSKGHFTEKCSGRMSQAR